MDYLSNELEEVLGLLRFGAVYLFYFLMNLLIEMKKSLVGFDLIFQALSSIS